MVRPQTACIKDRPFHERYKKVIGVYPTPLMGEEQQKLVATLPRKDIEGSPTMFTVSAVLRAARFTLADMRQWGGKIHSVSHPSDPARRAAIENRSVDAIFDEGIKSSGQTALDNGFRYLPIEGSVLKHMTALGFRRIDMSRCSFHGAKSAVQTIDFSGWPMIVHAGMSNDVAYALCEAIASRKDLIPTDNYKPLNLRQLCANDDQAPFDVPLHPGARRFYRERGYLK